VNVNFVVQIISSITSGRCCWTRATPALDRRVTWNVILPSVNEASLLVLVTSPLRTPFLSIIRCSINQRITLFSASTLLVGKQE